MLKYITEILIAVIAVSGPIIVLLIRQHYKLKTIDHALNNVEIDLVDGEQPGNAPSIRQKLNDIAKQLEGSIVRLEEDRRLDRLESVQQRHTILARIDDLKSDISHMKHITSQNAKDISETKSKLMQHIEEEQALLTQLVDGKIDFDIFANRVDTMLDDSEDLL